MSSGATRLTTGINQGEHLTHLLTNPSTQTTPAHFQHAQTGIGRASRQHNGHPCSSRPKPFLLLAAMTPIDSNGVKPSQASARTILEFQYFLSSAVFMAQDLSVPSLARDQIFKHASTSVLLSRLLLMRRTYPLFLDCCLCRNR